MDFIKTDWENTTKALQGLEKLLTCAVCNKLIRDPCTLGGCEHCFCRTCTEDVVDDVCPVCKIPSHVKDIQSNRQLKTAASLCKQLAILLRSSDDDGVGKNVEDGATSEDTIPSTPLNQLIPIRTNSNSTNEAPIERSEYDFTDSPVDSPPNPISGRTRKAQAKQRKEIFLKKSNADWNIGKNTLDKCSSCKRTQSQRGKRRVKFQRAAKFVAASYADESSESCGSEYHDVQDKDEIKRNISNARTASVRHTRSRNVNNPGDVESGARTNSVSPGAKITNTSVKAEHDHIVPNGIKPCQVKLNDNYTDTKNTDLNLGNKNSGVVAKNENVDKANEKPRGKVKNEPVLSTTPTRDNIPATPVTTRRKSPLVVSTPTSTPRGRRKTESPGQSPALLKKNRKGETPLHVAVIKGDYDRVKDLLEQGAPTNIKDHAGWTPLHEACHHGFTRIAELLLNHGSLINIPGCDNETPLHDAVSSGKIDIVRLLVSRGASVTDRNVNGKTAEDLAKLKSMDMAEALETPLACTQAANTAVELPVDLEIHQVVLLATGLSREKRRKLDQLASIFETKCLDEFSNEVTHLIAETNADNFCSRTMKYLKCVITGKWIVNFEWVEQCIELQQKVIEEAFVVRSCSPNPEALGPGRGRNNLICQHPGLFDGCWFYLRGNWGTDDQYRQDITQLIQLGGGQLLTREPKLDTTSESTTVPYHAQVDSSLAHCSTYIVHNNRSVPAKMASDHLCEAPASWIIECCAYFELIPPAPS